MRLKPKVLKPARLSSRLGGRGSGRLKLVQAVRGGQLNSATTFTRNDTVNYFDSAGLMQEAAVGEARTTWIDSEPYLWMDGQVTEISGRSFDFDNWDGISATQDATGIDGGITGWTVTDSNPSGADNIRLNTTVSSGADRYFIVTMFGHEDSPSVFPNINLALRDGTADIFQALVFDKSDGSYVEQAGGGTVVLEPIRFGDYWLAVISCTNTDNTRVQVRHWPAFNTDGSASVDNSAQGSTVFGYTGLFKDNFSLMPILTTGGTTATVAADVASLSNSIIAGMTEGTIFAEVWSPQLASNAARDIAELQTDSSNFAKILHAADGALDAQITDGGASQAALAGTDLTVGTKQKIALAFSEDDFALYRDGLQIDTDSGGTVPSFDTLLIGAGLFGGIKTLNVHTKAWSQATAEAETT